MKWIQAWCAEEMNSSVSREIPDGVSWHTLAGGMFLRAHLPAGMNAAQLRPKAVEKNVAFVPGAAFYAESRAKKVGEPSPPPSPGGRGGKIADASPVGVI